MARLKSFHTLILLTVFLVGSCQASYPPPESIECLEEGQLLPVVPVRSSYAQEDDPETELDESIGYAAFDGSAVVFADGYLLTAGHVVQGDPIKITFRTLDGQVEAKRIAIDPINDMALLVADTSGLDPLPLSISTLVSGQRMWTLGYPGGYYGPGISFGGPMISIRQGLLLVGAPVFEGMSGGAVLTCGEDGPEMAGIIVSYNTNEYMTNTYERNGVQIEERYSINSGTSNAPSAIMLRWFSEFAIKLYEEEKREK